MLVLCKVKAKLNKNKYNSKNLLSILKDVVERSIGAAKSSNGMLVFSDCVVPFVSSFFKCLPLCNTSRKCASRKDIWA